MDYSPYLEKFIIAVREHRTYHCLLSACCKSLAIMMLITATVSCEEVRYAIPEHPISIGNSIRLQQSFELWFLTGSTAGSIRSLKALPDIAELLESDPVFQVTEGIDITHETLTVKVKPEGIRVAVFGGRYYVDGYKVDASCVVTVTGAEKIGRQVPVLLELPGVSIVQDLTGGKPQLGAFLGSTSFPKGMMQLAVLQVCGSQTDVVLWHIIHNGIPLLLFIGFMVIGRLIYVKTQRKR